MSVQSNMKSAVKAFNLRNNPGLPEEKCTELTKKGVGVLDWGAGLSWDHTIANDDRQEAARRSFDAVQYLNDHGGYGVMHTEGFDTFTIGRIEPPCIRFRELENTDGKKRYFKLFQFDTYATIDDIKSRFPEVHKFAHNHAFMETLQMVEESADTESTPRAVTEAYVDLDLAGELEKVDF